MAYIYLLNLYEEIEKRLQQIDSLGTEESGTTHYQQGRRDILIEFRTFLTDNLNDKLPRRIRKRLTDRE